jgi:hypothetical protein
MTTQATSETILVRGSELLDQIRHLIRGGKVRSVIIKHDGLIVALFPQMTGVVGVVLTPVLAALGTFAALLPECTIEVERSPATSCASDELTPEERSNETLAPWME